MRRHHFPLAILLVLIQTLQHTSQHGHHYTTLHDDPLSHDTENTNNNCARKLLDQNDTTTVDLRLAKVKVPKQDTTYMCQTFDLPVTSDLDLHMIAVLPLIDAKEVVHHIILFGCDPRVPPMTTTGKSQECGIMPVASCQSLIGTWTMGSDGDCAHPKMGFRVGPQGYRQVFMQVHFNNPNLLEGVMDSSGLRLHFTESLRSNDAGMLIVGQRSLQINPLEYVEDSGADGTRYVSQIVRFTAMCPSRCTQHMFGENGIYITSAVNHMHALGVSQRIEVYRNNTLVNTITNQQDYNYNHPVIYTFHEPIHVLPGDELKTTCVYKRPTSQHPVCFGEATSDEMCFGFLTYFPSQTLKYPWCTSMGSMKSCDRHLPQLGLKPVNGCKWWEFRNISRSDTKMMLGRVLVSCYSSQGALQCGNEACKTVVQELMTHPCMQDDVGLYMIDRIKKYDGMGTMLMDALVTCSCRHFRHCDRRLSKGFLGSQQADWCPSNAPPMTTTRARWIGVQIWCSSIIVLCYYFCSL